jgi:hypothetical protein
VKPRLLSAPLTLEDLHIWCSIDARLTPNTDRASWAAYVADCHDADLMLALGRTVAFPGTPGPTARVLVYFSPEAIRDSVSELNLAQWEPGRLNRRYFA